MFCDSIVFPCTHQRIPQRKQHRGTQKQRRFADPLTTLYAPQMSPLNALKEVDVEFLRYITESGDLIGSWPSCSKLARLCPERFFHGEETETLDEGAFDLAVVNSGVDRTTDVHFDIRTKNGVRAC